MTKKRDYFMELLAIRNKQEPVMKSELKTLAKEYSKSKYTFYNWIREAQQDGSPLGGWIRMPIGTNKTFRTGKRDTVLFPIEKLNEVFPFIMEKHPECNMRKVSKLLKKIQQEEDNK